MKRFRIKVGDQKKYKFDFAPLENGNDDTDWLDRTSSPAEQIDSYTLTLESPTGISVLSDAREDSNTSIGVVVSATATGRYRLECQAVTSNSPQQKSTETMLFIVYS